MQCNKIWGAEHRGINTAINTVLTRLTGHLNSRALRLTTNTQTKKTLKTTWSQGFSSTLNHNYYGSSWIDMHSTWILFEENRDIPSKKCIQHLSCFLSRSDPLTWWLRGRTVWKQSVSHGLEKMTVQFASPFDRKTTTPINRWSSWTRLPV